MPKNSRIASKSSQTTKKNAKGQISSYVGMVIIAVVLIIFAGFYGYGVYKQSKIDNYNKSVKDILLRTANKFVKLNPYLRNFAAVPEHAKKLAPKFKKAADITSKAASDLKSVSPPKQFEPKHRKLTKAYEDGAQIYGDLNKFSLYLIKRDKVLKRLIKDLKGFANSISKTKDLKKAASIAKEAEARIKDDLQAIEKLKSPISIYDDKVLLSYSKSLAKHLKNFQKSLSGNDVYQIQLALYYIQLDYAKNWQKAFFTSDKKAVKSYEERVKSVQKITF